MKQVIELLEQVEALVMVTFSGDENSEECNQIINYLNDAMALLKTPCWETPEQYEKRTGEKWPDSGSVYYQKRTELCNTIDGKIVNEHWTPFSWFVETWGDAKEEISPESEYRKFRDYGLVICATEAGPPPDNWSSEEAEK